MLIWAANRMTNQLYPEMTKFCKVKFSKSDILHVQFVVFVFNDWNAVITWQPT